jgi:hypothetical protein
MLCLFADVATIADQINLPASTIAWHWSQSCRDVEATQVCRLPALLCTPLHPFALHAVSPCPLLLAMATHQSTVAHPACSPIALQWPRSFRAAEWWERSALDAVDNGTYSDALPLLQKAQVGA